MKKTDVLDTLSIYDMENTVDEIIDNLYKIKDSYKQYTNIRFIVEYDNYADMYRYKICGDRDETKKELASRLKIEKDQNDKQLKYDLELYKKLDKILKDKGII